MAAITKYRTKRGPAYRVEFRRNAQLFCIRGFDYKPAAESVRAKINRLEELADAGRKPDAELTAWPNTIPPAWRERLAKAGLVDRAYLLAGKPLAYHLIGFYNALRAKGRTRKHARLIVKRVVWISRGPAYWTWATAKPKDRKRPAPLPALCKVPDLTAGVVESHLAELRDNGKGITAQTYNHYLQAAKQFCRWLVSVGRADHNLLANCRPLERAKVRRECKRERRAATVEEMRALCWPT